MGLGRVGKGRWDGEIRHRRFTFLSVELLFHFYSLLFLPASTKCNIMTPFLSAYYMSFNSDQNTWSHVTVSITPWGLQRWELNTGLFKILSWWWADTWSPTWQYQHLGFSYWTSRAPQSHKVTAMGMVWFWTLMTSPLSRNILPSAFPQGTNS